MRTKFSVRIRRAFIFIVLFGLMGSLFEPSNSAAARAARLGASHASSRDTEACHPGTGWVWTSGPSQPDAAREAEAALNDNGITAAVTAYAYGENDSCGTFVLYSVDYDVRLMADKMLSTAQREEKGDQILSLLSALARPQLGNVRIDSGSGVLESYRKTASLARPNALSSYTSTNPVISRKVYLIIFDPILSDGQKLSVNANWQVSPAELSQQVVEAFALASRGEVSYELNYISDLDEWPLFVDGFRYTEDSFHDDYYNHHQERPTEFDYDSVASDPRFDICSKVNSGQVDEIWIYAMPYARLAESELLGPGGYWYNSVPMADTHGCNRLVPIMGLNYEREAAQAEHSFGHRAENSMRRIYGEWDENTTDNNWERFALAIAKSPSYDYSGCGDIHFPPNGYYEDPVWGYDYSNTVPVDSNCEDFRNYPNLSDPSQVLESVTCLLWGCTHDGYLMYWFGHLPANPGYGSDDVAANDWWPYVADPNMALDPSFPYLHPSCPWITDWRGEYWNNDSLQGAPALCRNDLNVNFDWVNGSPSPLIGDDHFSARWTRASYFDQGLYQFSVYHDDGARMLIDGSLVPGGDFWDTACQVDTVVVSLTAGIHEIQFEMFENTGWTRIEAAWQLVTYTISGNVGRADATLSYYDGGPKSAWADSSGGYSIVVPDGWSGTVTPYRSGYSFNPPSRSYDPIASNLAGQDYTAFQVQTAVYRSIASQDGWILETGENTNRGGILMATDVTFKLGDDATRKQYRTILSFNTSGLPDNAVITNVKLKLTQRSATPIGSDPFNIFQGVLIDMRKGFFGSGSGLQAADFQTVGSTSGLGPFKPIPTGTLYTISLPSSAYAAINKAGTNGGVTQLRLRFKLDDNNNRTANYISFYSGNYTMTNYRPTLTITYHLP